MKQDGIDYASYSAVVWCACGWRSLTSKSAAVAALDDHRIRVHDRMSYQARNTQWAKEHRGMK